MHTFYSIEEYFQYKSITNYILRIKEQETRLNLHEHDDDDDDEIYHNMIKCH